MIVVALSCIFLVAAVTVIIGSIIWASNALSGIRFGIRRWYATLDLFSEFPFYTMKIYRIKRRKLSLFRFISASFDKRGLLPVVILAVVLSFCVVIEKYFVIAFVHEFL